MMSSTAPNSLEIDYIASKKNNNSNNNNSCLKTELSLSLPGSQESDHQVLGPSLFDQPNPHPFNSVKNNRSYDATWHFADASSAGEWGLSVNGAAFFSHGAGAGKGVNGLEIDGGVCKKSGQLKDMDIDVASDSQKPSLEKKPTATAPAPAAKAQVVGWPPIRSFRKNSVASASTKNSNEADGKSGLNCLYVKVSMDGAPYLRKVDLKLYKNYKELSLALKKMFSSFPVGKDGPGDSHLNHDLPQDSVYVLTYEDKEGDWMLVGDVPWDMFTSTCKRLRIMKGSGIRGNWTK